jgi:shikimate dehydrogenase
MPVSAHEDLEPAARFAVLGWPVAHSLSPTMFTAAFEVLGVDERYVALPVAPEDVLDVLARLGLGGARGANVTVPHKLAVMPACDVLTEEARLVGAVNTLTWEDGRLEGHNTDAIGLAAALREDIGGLEEQPVVLIGTGGAARAAAVALARAGARLNIVGRDPQRAGALATVATRAGGRVLDVVDIADDAALAAVIRWSRLVLNATSVGLAGERLPSACEELGPDHVAYDLIYRPAPTPFLAAAIAGGAQAFGGLGMLVHQAAAALERWTGLAAPVAAMRARVEDALREA